jgi:ribose transport system permease protein
MTQVKLQMLTVKPSRRGPRQAGTAGRLALRAGEQFGLVFALVVLVLTFSLLRPDTFPTAENWQTILQTQSVLAVSAFAIIVPLTGGRFDISVGSVVALSCIATAAAMSSYHLPLAVAVVVGIAIGAGVGLVNGVLIAYLAINSLIATLATSTIIGGLIDLYTTGIPISTGISTRLTDLSIEKVGGLPALFVIMLGIAAAVWYLLVLTPYGRQLAGIGSSIEAARLVGIRVPRSICLSFVISGGLAGLGGVLELAQQGSANPQIGGISFMLPGLAAAFLGATTIRPGTYNVPGTLVGLYFVGVAVSGLALLGAEPWVQPVFNGAAVLVAVGASTYIRRKRTGAQLVGE